MSMLNERVSECEQLSEERYQQLDSAAGNIQANIAKLMGGNHLKINKVIKRAEEVKSDDAPKCQLAHEYQLVIEASVVKCGELIIVDNPLDRSQVILSAEDLTQVSKIDKSKAHKIMAAYLHAESGQTYQSYDSGTVYVNESPAFESLEEVITRFKAHRNNKLFIIAVTSKGTLVIIDTKKNVVVSKWEGKALIGDIVATQNKDKVNEYAVLTNKGLQFISIQAKSRGKGKYQFIFTFTEDESYLNG